MFWSDNYCAKRSYNSLAFLAFHREKKVKPQRIMKKKLEENFTNTTIGNQDKNIFKDLEY